MSDPDEIYGLNLPGAGSESEDGDDGAEDDGAEDDDEEDDMYDSHGNLKSANKAATDEPRGRFAKTANPSQDIIANSSDDDSDAAPSGPAPASDSDDAQSAHSASDSDGEETWAPGSYHASRRAPGEADSSDDEALELEAAEARRLQQLAKGRLGGDDFGLDAAGEAEGTAEEVRKAAREKRRLEEQGEEGGEAVAVAGRMSEEEAIAHLVRNSPETLALLDDFAATAVRMESVEKDLDTVRKGQDDGREHPALAIMELEHRELEPASLEWRGGTAD